MLLRSASFAILIASAGLASAQTVPPVLTPTDPSLRLWLRADAGVTSESPGPGDPGRPVLQWQDQSQYGTILAPRTDSNPNGPIGGFPVEEKPNLVSTTLNGNTFPTIRFDVSGDAFADLDSNGNGPIDRLYQTNNLGANDPLVIADGQSFTSFAVFLPTNTTTPALGFQSVYAKRGTNGSLYGLQIKNVNNFGQFLTVSYDATEQYLTGTKPVENKFHVTSLVIEDVAGPNDPLKWFDDGSESVATKMVDVGVRERNGITPVTTFASRNPASSVTEPFAIGGHSQNCCGELEEFRGNIAEIIIFARTLTPQEFADVENYLDAKYFATAPAGVAGDYNKNGAVDAADYTLYRDKQGQTFTLDNENPAAITPGLVDTEDYTFWQSRFGSTSGSASLASVSVPEPSTLSAACGLAASALLMGIFTSHSRR